VVATDLHLGPKVKSHGPVFKFKFMCKEIETKKYCPGSAH
jgi:hypothetical protein